MRSQTQGKPNQWMTASVLCLVVGLGCWLVFSQLSEDDPFDLENIHGPQVEEVPLAPEEHALRDTPPSERKASEDLAIEEIVLVDDPEAQEGNGWGRIAGQATVNGAPVNHGIVRWWHESSGEFGKTLIVDGSYSMTAPPGRLWIGAQVRNLDSLWLPELDIGAFFHQEHFSFLNKWSRYNLKTAEEREINWSWSFESRVIQGEARFRPSQTPYTGSDLQLTGASLGTQWFLSTADGRFRAMVPIGFEYKVGARICGRLYETPVLQGEWTLLWLPDQWQTTLVVYDGVRERATNDYNAYWRERGTLPWYSIFGHRTKRPPKVGISALIPAQNVELLILAPRLNLKPWQGEPRRANPNHIEPTYTLQAGGSILFNARTWPDTGIIMLGGDPVPILVVEETLSRLPKRLSFAEWVSQPKVLGTYPESYFQDRRLEFNRHGEAEVKGLPSGTYHLLHWRKNLEWNPGPIQVREGVTTKVTLTGRVR